MEVAIGDVIEIKSKPRLWSSALCNENPLSLEYPRVFKVIKIADFDSFNRGALILQDVGNKMNYGFDLTYAEQAGFTFLNKKLMSNSLIKEIIRCQKKI